MPRRHAAPTHDSAQVLRSLVAHADAHGGGGASWGVLLEFCSVPQPPFASARTAERARRALSGLGPWHRARHAPVIYLPSADDVPAAERVGGRERTVCHVAAAALHALCKEPTCAAPA